MFQPKMRKIQLSSTRKIPTMTLYLIWNWKCEKYSFPVQRKSQLWFCIYYETTYHKSIERSTHSIHEIKLNAALDLQVMHPPSLHLIHDLQSAADVQEKKSWSCIELTDKMTQLQHGEFDCILFRKAKENNWNLLMK